MTTSKFPEGLSSEGQWHNISLDFKIDNFSVDWDLVDRRKFVINLTKILTYCALKGQVEEDNSETARTYVKRVDISRTDFVTDDELRNWLDGLSE